MKTHPVLFYLLILGKRKRYVRGTSLSLALCSQEREAKSVYWFAINTRESENVIFSLRCSSFSSVRFTSFVCVVTRKANAKYKRHLFLMCHTPFTQYPGKFIFSNSENCLMLKCFIIWKINEPCQCVSILTCVFCKKGLM